LVNYFLKASLYPQNGAFKEKYSPISMPF